MLPPIGESNGRLWKLDISLQPPAAGCWWLRELPLPSRTGSSVGFSAGADGGICRESVIPNPLFSWCSAVLVPLSLAVKRRSVPRSSCILPLMASAAAQLQERTASPPSKDSFHQRQRSTQSKDRRNVGLKSEDAASIQAHLGQVLGLGIVS